MDHYDWQLQWGDTGGEGNMFPPELLRVASSLPAVERSTVESVLSNYMEQTVTQIIRLPFVLQYREVQQGGSEALDWLDFPRQIFSLELSFSSTEHFVPIDTT